MFFPWIEESFPLGEKPSDSRGHSPCKWDRPADGPGWRAHWGRPTVGLEGLGLPIRKGGGNRDRVVVYMNVDYTRTTKVKGAGPNIII